MIIERELCVEIRRVLAGEIALNDLYRWLSARTWNMHKDSSPSAIDLACAVEVLFYERGDGDINALETKAQLADLLKRITPARTLRSGETEK